MKHRNRLEQIGTLRLEPGDNVMRDRRRDERVPLPMEVAWEGDSGKYTSRISDISMSGCYVESIAQTSVGEKVRFEIQLPSGKWLPLIGVVVYRHPQIGFGVNFTTLADGVTELLAELMDYARSQSR
ncbi:MAG TPA: PilZ domain-containing protein [Pyrinomonadaceae bacterium]